MAVVFFLLAANPLPGEGTLSFGFKLGPSIAFGSGNSDLNVIDTRTGAGFSGGGFAEYAPFSWLAVELDVFLTWFNYGLKINLPPERTVGISYGSFELPLLVKGRLNLGKGVGFLSAGIDFMLILGDVAVERDGVTTITRVPDRLFYPSFVVGTGYNFSLEKTYLSVEIRYIRTFSSVVDSPDTNMFVNRFDFLVGIGGYF